VILNGDGTLNAGKTEMHFEGHPTGVDVTKFVLHHGRYDQRCDKWKSSSRKEPGAAMKRLLSFFLLASSVCWSQSTFTIPLEKANSALALPSMAARDGVLYAAYRSFDLLRFSSKLEVVVYDLNTHKELQHVTISVPKVHGARASEGLFLSEDGQTLAYAELHEPGLILLLAAKNLAEIRRSTALPFTSLDHHLMFAGFDGDQTLHSVEFLWLPQTKCRRVAFYPAWEYSTSSQSQTRELSVCRLKLPRLLYGSQACERHG